VHKGKQGSAQIGWNVPRGIIPQNRVTEFGGQKGGKTIYHAKGKKRVHRRKREGPRGAKEWGTSVPAVEMRDNQQLAAPTREKIILQKGIPQG